MHIYTIFEFSVIFHGHHYDKETFLATFCTIFWSILVHLISSLNKELDNDLFVVPEAGCYTLVTI